MDAIIWFIGYVLFCAGFFCSCLLVARVLVFLFKEVDWIPEYASDGLYITVFTISLLAKLWINTRWLEAWQMYIMPVVTSCGLVLYLCAMGLPYTALMATMLWIYTMEYFGFFGGKGQVVVVVAN